MNIIPLINEITNSFNETFKVSLTPFNLESRIKDVGDLFTLKLEDERILTIIENKEEYPDILLEMLGRNIDMLDYMLEYPKKKGNVYVTKLENIKKDSYPLLLQYDTR